MYIRYFLPDVKEHTYALPKSLQYFSYGAGAATFIILCYFFEDNASATNYLFLFWPRLLYYTAPVGIFLFVALTIALLVGLFYIIWQAFDAMGEKQDKDVDNVWDHNALSIEQLETTLFFLGVVTILFLTCAHFLGQSLSEFMEGNRSAKPDAEGGIPYFILYFLLLPAWVVWLVRWSPLLIAGWSMMGTVHPAKAAIDRTVARKRADRTAALELASVLRAQELDDARALELFNSLSPFRQKIWQAQYAKRTREAKQLRALVQSQGNAIREEVGLAHDVVGMERTRRAIYDR